MKGEIKTPGYEFIPVDFFELFHNQLAQDPPVSSQYILDVPDEFLIPPVHPVVVIVPAKVRTEFFIRSAFDRLTTVETGSHEGFDCFLKYTNYRSVKRNGNQDTGAALSPKPGSLSVISRSY